MRFRVTITVTAVAILALVGVAGAARANTADRGGPAVCTWGGTPDAPTGRFTFTPGLTQFTPSSGPLKFYATGELSGGGPCQGRMVFNGVAEPGATCPAFVVDGKVEGVPGVVRFSGGAAAAVVQEFLYDREGRIVGSDQPQALTNYDHFTDCLRPEGFTAGNFSAIVEFYATPLDPDGAP
jgi:hypothetical protein